MSEQVATDQVPTTQSPNVQSRRSTGATVYRHRKRPSWGLAAFLWEREGKRGYQFQDGMVRVFKEGFFDMMVPISSPQDQAAARSVRRLAARNKAGHTTGSKAVPRVADQIGLFMSQYPEGFAGAAWQKEVRGRGAKRALKRHRDRPVQLAKDLLGRDALAEAIEMERWATVRDRTVDVLRVTDLVSKKEVDKLAALEPNRAVAWAIYNLLYGEQVHHKNVDAFVRDLGRMGLKVSWQLVTALPALVHPNEHVCIRPSVFKEQARMVKPKMKAGTKPKGRVYTDYLDVVAIVLQELEAAGRKPGDLLDVAQFVWITLRPSSRERLVGAGDNLSEIH